MGRLRVGSSGPEGSPPPGIKTLFALGRGKRVMVIQMKQLIALQACDSRIREVEERKKLGPERINRLNEELKEVEKRLQDESDQLEKYRQERRDMEREIEDIEARIRKSNSKLAAISSNREYKAALKEIDDLKRTKALSEDRVLAMMEEIERLQAACAQNREKQEGLRQQTEAECREIEAEMASLDKVLQDLERERDRLSTGIDEDLLRRYHFLKGRKDGLAISPVVKGVCQTCHMDIPPQRFNEVIRGDRLMTCPHCNRIIYWGEDERFVSAKEEA